MPRGDWGVRVACGAARFVSPRCSCVTRWAFGDALGAVRSEVRAVSFKWRACIVLQARHFVSLAPLRDGWISGNNAKPASEKNSDCFTALDRVIFA